ncbi:hypothetical protein HDR60_01270 [bacterium]|nr:hypothetical protein [bacterium]
MSFFGEFKNSLKDDTGDLGGRYFAKVIAEVIKENPWFLSILYKDIPEKVDIISVEEETSFNGESGKNRRNDLEIQYVDNTNEPQTLYIEIKWEDNTHENQICDYIDNVNKETNAKFLLLTLNELEDREDDLKLIKDCETAEKLTCPELYEKLIRHKNSKNNWLIKQFIHFLKENAMIYEQNINKKALIRFMKNAIGWDHNDGLGKNLTQSTMDEYPTLLRALLSNVHKVSLEIFKRYKDKGDKVQSPYTDFFIQNNCTNYKEHQAGHFAVRTGNGADEGKFIIHSRFKTDKYLAYGIFFYVHKNKNEKGYSIDLYTFANLYGSNSSTEDIYNDNKFDTFNIKDLDKDDEGKEIIKFPEANKLLEKIQSNIDEVVTKVKNIL